MNDQPHRPRLVSKMSPQMQAEVDELRAQIDPNALGEIENGGNVAKPMEPLKLERYDRPQYWAEVGPKGRDFIYHFFPLEGRGFPPDFHEKMSAAFLEVFKSADRLEAVASQEMNSWAVRARGFSHALIPPDLPTRVFDVLDQKLA